MYMKLYEVTFGMRLYLGMRLFMDKYSMSLNHNMRAVQVESGTFRD